MLKIIFPIISLLIIKKWHYSIHSLLFLSLIIFILFSPLNIPFSPIQLISLDFIRLPLIILSTWITALIILARYIVNINKSIPKQFLNTCLLLLLSLIIAFAANNLLIFYIAFETSLIPTLILILIWGYQPERLQARIYIIIYTVTASLPLLIGILIIHKSTSSLNIFSYLVPIFPSFPKVWWLILISAFIAKMPLYGTHLWLPKAHVEAPVAGSIALAGILLKLGSYGLIRIRLLFPFINISITNIIVPICIVGGIITALTCTRQPDLKSLIAYSSVAHIALLTAGAISNTLWGWEGALVIILAHGLARSALFAIANATYETTQTRRLFLTKGLLSLFPSISIWWFLLITANLGGPPSINLIRELLLLTSILSMSSYLRIPIALISFFAATYCLILFTSTQHGPLPLLSNPLNIQHNRIHLLILLHVAPLFLIVLKSSFISLWLWFCSWNTTLDCKPKSAL